MKKPQAFELPLSFPTMGMHFRFWPPSNSRIKSSEDSSQIAETYRRIRRQATHLPCAQHIHFPIDGLLCSTFREFSHLPNTHRTPPLQFSSLLPNQSWQPHLHPSVPSNQVIHSMQSFWRPHLKPRAAQSTPGLQNQKLMEHLLQNPHLPRKRSDPLSRQPNHLQPRYLDTPSESLWKPTEPSDLLCQRNK